MFRFKAQLQRAARTAQSVRRMSKFDDFKQSVENLKNTPTKGPVTFWTLGFTTITAIGILGIFQIEKDRKEKARAKNIRSVGKPDLGGPWVLTDQDGHPRTDASYDGRFRLMYFGFTYCPDICPSELVKIGNIVKACEKKKITKLQPIFISVDPNRDTVGQLKNYSQDFHPSIVYLTGTKEQVAAATKAYRVYFSKANENESDTEDYLVDHSIVLYLVSPSGEFVDFFTQSMETKDIVDKIAGYVKQYYDNLAAIEANKGKKVAVKEE